MSNVIKSINEQLSVIEFDFSHKPIVIGGKYEENTH